MISRSPKISVIIPIYNVEEYLDRCMQSLLNQTLKDIEIILVDDGSSDRCPQMCEKYAKQDSRIKVIHKRNAGLGLARNSGLEIATGEYVAFVDSDDYVDLQMYEKLYKEIEHEDWDIVYCGFNKVLLNGKLIRNDVSDRCIKGDDVIGFLANMIASEASEIKERKESMAVWHAIYKKSIFDFNNIRFKSEREILSEDIVFDINFIPHCKKIRVIPESLYFYCSNENSLSHTFKPEKIIRNVNLFNTLKEIATSKNLSVLNLRIMRLFIGYNRAFLEDIVLSNYSIQEKKSLCKRIYELNIWNDIYKLYPIKSMPFYHRVVLMTIQYKMFYFDWAIFYIVSILKGKP